MKNKKQVKKKISKPRAKKPSALSFTRKDVKKWNEVNAESIHKIYPSIQKHGGKQKAFESTDHLADKFDEYKKFVDDTPFYTNEAKSGAMGIPTIVQIPVRRPYSINGFSHFCGLSARYFYTFILEREKDIANEKLPERVRKEAQRYLEIYEFIKEQIYQQKFDGAVVSHFNATIIARDLNLIDKSEVNNTHVIAQQKKDVADLFPPTLNAPQNDKGKNS
jgi:hypothetical protein